MPIAVTRGFTRAQVRYEHGVLRQDCRVMALPLRVLPRCLRQLAPGISHLGIAPSDHGTWASRTVQSRRGYSTGSHQHHSHTRNVGRVTSTFRISWPSPKEVHTEIDLLRTLRAHTGPLSLLLIPSSIFNSLALVCRARECSLQSVPLFRARHPLRFNGGSTWSWVLCPKRTTVDVAR